MTTISGEPLDVELRGPNPWPVLMVVGGLTAALGIWLLFSWNASVATIAILLAVGLFLNGISELAWASDRSSPWVGYVLGALFVIGGVIVVLQPGTGLRALALVMGITLIAVGIFQTAGVILAHDEMRHAGWILAFALLTVFVGAAAIIWPQVWIRAIGILFGIRLLVIGIGSMVAGNEFRKLSH